MIRTSPPKRAFPRPRNTVITHLPAFSVTASVGENRREMIEPEGRTGINVRRRNRTPPLEADIDLGLYGKDNSDVSRGPHDSAAGPPHFARSRKGPDRKSTRLNSSHSQISYAV